MTDPLMHEVSWLLHFNAEKIVRRCDYLDDLFLSNLQLRVRHQLAPLRNIVNIKRFLLNKNVPRRCWLDIYSHETIDFPNTAATSSVVLDLDGEPLRYVQYYDMHTKKGLVVLHRVQDIDIHRVSCGGVVWFPTTGGMRNLLLRELPEDFHKFVAPVEFSKYDCSLFPTRSEKAREFCRWAVKEQSKNIF